MMDDEPIEIGKLQGRFLSDERGRRIYFPPFGLARLVPSRNAEAKLREREFFLGFGAMVPLVAAQAVDVFWPERSLLNATLWTCCALLIVVSHMSGQVSARHWTAIPASDCSHERCVMAEYARRQFIFLVLTALLRCTAFVFLATLPVLAVYAVLAQDADAKIYRAMPAFLIVLALLPSAWQGACRPIRAVYSRLCGPSPAQ
jgi:hypothetical protein